MTPSGGVASLQPGRPLSGRFAVARKDRQQSKAGTPYLSLELRDRTGSIPARIFREADQLGARFERGDAIEARGKVERYRGRLSVEITALRRIEPDQVDPAEFLPSAYRSVEELEGFLEHLTGEIYDEPLRALVEAVTGGEPAGSEFRRAPCTRGGHHAYLGGLLEHTVAVGTLALECCQLHVKLNSDLLITAALVHDLGKTREYVYGAEIELSEPGRLIGHVELGLRLIDEHSGRLDEARRLQLAHCVLTHHGADAAPQRRFASPEALALFRLNAVDAAVKGALEGGTG